MIIHWDGGIKNPNKDTDSLLATRNLAKVLQKKAENRISGTDKTIFFKNANRGLFHLLNVCHPGRSACRLLIISRGIATFVCPSNLGEYSLVHLLFFQNLHWVFGYGLQCLGPEDISGNILASESYNFFYTISFCRFLNFKNLSSPELALFQGVFRIFLYFE